MSSPLEISPSVFKYSELAKSYETTTSSSVHNNHQDDKSDCESDTSEVLSVGSERVLDNNGVIRPTDDEMMTRLSSTP